MPNHYCQLLSIYNSKIYTNIRAGVRHVRCVRPEQGRRYFFWGAIFQTALRYLLTYFLPRENNYIANISLSGSQKGSNLRLKCAGIRLAAELHPDPLWELKHSSRPPSGNEGPSSKGREKGGWKGRGGRRGRRGKGRRGLASSEQGRQLSNAGTDKYKTNCI